MAVVAAAAVVLVRSGDEVPREREAIPTLGRAARVARAGHDASESAGVAAIGDRP